MALDNILNQINKELQYLGLDIKEIKNKSPKPRVGIYAIALLGTLFAYRACTNSQEILENQTKILEAQTKMIPQVQVKNVVGLPIPDKFYVINGEPVFIEVDGVKTIHYFPNF